MSNGKPTYYPIEKLFPFPETFLFLSRPYPAKTALPSFFLHIPVPCCVGSLCLAKRLCCVQLLIRKTRATSSGYKVNSHSVSFLSPNPQPGFLLTPPLPVLQGGEFSEAVPCQTLCPD